MQSIFKFFLLAFALMELTACGGAGHNSTPPAGTSNPSSSTASSSSSSVPTIEASVWTGADDSLISFSTALPGLELSRRDNESCTACTIKTDKVSTDGVLSDSTLTLNKPAYYELKAPGFSRATAVTSASIFGSNQALTTFNNTLWLLVKGTPTRLWQSSDAQNWQEKILPNISTVISSKGATFSDSIGDSKLIVFNKKLWLFAAIDTYTRINFTGYYYENSHRTSGFKVWNTTDGITWAEQTINLPRLTMCCYSMQAFNNKLWLLDNNSSSENNTQLWSSANGNDWVQETLPDVSFQNANVTLGQFKQQLWLVANSEDGFTTDFRMVTVKGGKYSFWSSGNGQNWKSEIINTDRVFRKNFQLTDTGTHLILAGGTCFYANDRYQPQVGIDVERPCMYTGEISTDLQWWPETADFLLGVPVLNPAKLNQTWWSVIVDPSHWSAVHSTDAFTWEEPYSPENPLARTDGAVVNFKGKLWSFGTKTQTSTDGLHWQTDEKAIPYGGIVTPVEFKNKLFLPTYATFDKPNQLWTSEDGLNWIAQPAPEILEINSSVHPIIVASPDKLFWLANDKLFTSSDGIEWQTAAPLPATGASGALWFNNQLLIAFNDPRYYLMVRYMPHSNPYLLPATQIMSSSNGTDWTKLSDTIGIAFGGHLFYKFDNRLWLTGRCDNEERACAEVSSDGITWKSVDKPSPLIDLENNYQYPVEYNQLLWLFDENRANEVWHTDNGTDWRKGHLVEFKP